MEPYRSKASIDRPSHRAIQEHIICQSLARAITDAPENSGYAKGDPYLV